jgi:hypothetical protein
MTTDITTIADRYAALKAQADAIAKQLSTLRDEVLADGGDLYKGDKAWLVVSLIEDSTRLDSEIAKKYLTPEQIAFSSKVVKGTARITIKAPF